MTDLNKSFSILRTAEFVLPGHPDKLADAIADAIVKQARRLERRALVGVEVALHRDVCLLMVALPAMARKILTSRRL